MMRNHRCLALVAALAAFVVGAASVAYANTLTQQVTGSIAPQKLPKRTYRNASVHVRTEASDSGNIPANANHAKISLDDDIAFRTGSAPQCKLSNVSGKPTAAARSACHSSQVGTGTAALYLGAPGSPITPANTLPVTVSVFNGQPSGGKPTVIFHADPGFVPVDIIGKLVKSNVSSGDYGKMLDIIIPPTGGSLGFFDVTIKKGRYIQARCRDKNRTFNYHGDFTFESTGGLYPTSASGESTSKCKVKKQ